MKEKENNKKKFASVRKQNGCVCIAVVKLREVDGWKEVELSKFALRFSYFRRVHLLWVCLFLFWPDTHIYILVTFF